MSKWSDAWNEMPDSVRYIGAMVECELRIQHLNFEKDRLKKRYEQSIKEINSHIENCKYVLRGENEKISI